MRGRAFTFACCVYALLGCSSFGGSDIKATDPATDVADAGGDEAKPPIDGVPAGCNPDVEPKASPLCVSDGYGIFVDSTNGDDLQPGTKSAPARTIAAALKKLAGRPRVYLCEGTFTERVEITDAASIYGGFACDSWEYTGKRTRIAPATPGLALHIAAVAGAVVIADADFTSLPGTDGSTSSIAAFLSDSAAVGLLRVSLTAQNAANGKNGNGGAPGALISSTPGAGTLSGNGMSADRKGGAAQQCTCSTTGITTGGRGATIVPGGGTIATAGGPAQVPSSPATATGAVGVSNGFGTLGIAPARGSDAPPSPIGNANTLVGILDASGFHPSSGGDGTDGAPGQGGGGACPYADNPSQQGTMFGGGGGGCGGCGGRKGIGGDGGGASVALLVLNSTVTLVGCALTAGNAGAGGSGGRGGTALDGGSGGAGAGIDVNHTSLPGAVGGRGADGGGGAGGAGGLSVGLLYAGKKPSLDATIATGAAGARGPGAVPATNDGTDGTKADVLLLQ